jgi:hypothetical protein
LYAHRPTTVGVFAEARRDGWGRLCAAPSAALSVAPVLSVMLVLGVGAAVGMSIAALTVR